MGTFICPGFEGHPCGTNVERTGHYQKRCRECSKEKRKLCNREWNKVRYAADREERKMYGAAYYDAHKKDRKAYRDAHKEQIKAYDAAYRAARREELKAYRVAHREEHSVKSHHHWIFGTKKTLPRKNNEGMPFCDAWNPKKGGSFRAGGDWIIANLGKKPEGCSLHVIDHAKGFVPGNLEWTYPVKQSAERMFKIIARQKHQIKELQIENQKLRAEIQETKTLAA